MLTENIESIQKINKNINDIINLDISELFKEYGSSNLVFTIIEMKKEVAQIFLQLRIDGKKINKKISLNRGTNFNEIDFNNRIILEIKKVIKNIVKSQNLIDVRTPSFLNVEIRLNNKNNLVVFNNRISKIDLIENYFVQQLNKDFVLVKIKYLGKINKIINKLKEQNIILENNNDQWILEIIS